MRIETEIGLVYDDTDERCHFYFQRIKGKESIAFIQCFDIDSDQVMRLVGESIGDSEEQRAECIKEVMDHGYSFNRLINYWEDKK